MTDHLHEPHLGHPRVVRAGAIVLHAAAITTAAVLMVASLGMSMSVVLLPFGLFVGVSGLLLMVWGLFK